MECDVHERDLLEKKSFSSHIDLQFDSEDGRAENKR